jgi:hypothetical protein
VLLAHSLLGKPKGSLEIRCAVPRQHARERASCNDSSQHPNNRGFPALDVRTFLPRSTCPSVC